MHLYIAILSPMRYNNKILVLETKIYVPRQGLLPFIIWLESLDATLRHRIQERIDRLRLGNFGDSKALKNGIFELRCHFGAGLRIYYGIDRNVIVLLCGGDKSTQKKDISQSKRFWQDYGATHAY
jgi:putative addiction module killer protein